MKPIRVGIAGARRAREGLGPFVARELRAAGADVVAFSCTTRESVAAADRALAGVGVTGARGHVGVDALLASESLDALAILTPAGAHAECLEAALGAGLHVLCEKPLVWDVADPAELTRRLVDEFAARRRVLSENCQWPYTLTAFEALHPGTLVAGRPPRRFGMRLSPSSTGARMLVDVLSHPLSVLQHLCGANAGRIEDVGFSTRDPRTEALCVRFVLCTPRGDVEVEVELVGRSRPPREAWLTIEGRQARRTIRTGDYAFGFEADGRRVELADPLAALVRDFVAAAGGAVAPPSRAGAIVWRMEAVCEIVRAFGGEVSREERQP
ncbi:MAG: Gfo/Idh/MocA family oxidoreductase [Deltaproteobacteria bacterium]|nr:Gfo/Idh/MocA family oxidoreductase [Deltaproteobacteria bacterium]